MKTSSTILYLVVIPLLLSTIVNAVPTPVDADSFSLKTDMTSLADNVKALHKALASRHRTVAQVIKAANLSRKELCNDLVYAPLIDRSGSEVIGYCWTEADAKANYWYPQGVTTSHDASQDGLYENKTIVLNSWYHIPEKEGPKTPYKGVRVTFTGWDNDSSDTYAHVLLVQPTADGNFKIIPVHAGGIMWYGNLLYIADTWSGFRIFDMNHIYQMDTGAAYSIGRKANGKAYAFNHKFILVQTGYIHNSGAVLQYSFVSLDRASSPISMIVGEYSIGSADDNNTHIVRYPLDNTILLPLQAADGKTYASEAYETHILKMQGALARDGRFWFSSSSGGASGPVGNYGRLRVWDRGTTEVRKYSWTYASEDLSYWEDSTNSANDMIWTLTEFPNNRVVVAIPQIQWT